MNNLSPVTIRNLTDAKRLELYWRDGSVESVAHDRLRSCCRCAHCIAAQVRTGQPVSVIPNVTLLDVEQVGAYGVRLVFNDGHSRGIYPWAYLRELAGGHTQP